MADVQTRGGSAGRNKVIYNKDLDMTYILSPDGKTQIGAMEGNHLDNPLAFMGDSAKNVGMQSPFTPKSIPDRIEQMGKDFVVNAASQAPLMIPGGGVLPAVLKTAGSVGAGYGLDQLLNPSRSSSDSMGQAVENTAIAHIIPWLSELKFNGLRTPGIRTTETSVTRAAPTTMERSTVGQGSTESLGTTKGTTDTAGSGRSSGSGTTSTEGTSTTEGTSNRATTGKSARTTTIMDESMSNPETPEMSDIRAEIHRLTERLNNTTNKGNITKIQNAINRNQTALEVLKETREARVIRSQGTSESESKGSTGSISSREGKSTNSQESQSSSSSSSTNRSSSENRSSNTNTSTTTGSTQPGESVTTRERMTTGTHIVERLLEALNVTHSNTLSSMQKALRGLGFNTGVDVLRDSKK